jgi:hypothetical protein
LPVGNKTNVGSRNPPVVATSPRVLVTISDGTPLTLVGIHLLLRSLVRHRPDFSKEWEPVVLIPSWAVPLREEHRGLLRGQRVLPIEHSRRDDPYTAKFVLHTFVSDLPEATEVLYLDYDHICLAPLMLATPPNGVVLVGSRVGKLRVVAECEGRAEARALWWLTQGRYFNDSLMHGLCSTLNTALSSWQNEYANLTGLVEARVLEETAFSASAARAGAQVQPVGWNVQGDWERCDRDAQLFHYGGESAQATTLKAEMPSLIQDGALSRECNALLRSSIVGRRVLVELLAGRS